jgi:hypothetical protein
VGPESAVLFGVVMLMMTPAGQTWRASEVTRWCQDAGFPQVDQVVVADQGFGLLLAT